MPYNIVNPGSVEDAWKDKSMMDMVNNQVAQQPPVNSVFNQTQIAENPQPIPTQPATQVVSQGMGRKPTLQDYQAFAIDYLSKKGYSYDDAMELMKPEFDAYALREKAQNQAMADNLIADMQNMKIDSPEYRQAALQLYRLDPKMGEFMLKEGIGPREQFLYGRKLSDLAAAQQQRRSDAVFNNDLRFSNFVKQREWADAYAQRQMDARYQWAKSRGADDQSAMAFAMGSSGGRRNASGISATAGTVTKDDYKQAVEGKKALLAQIEERRMTDPAYQLSPYEQELYNMYDTVERKHNAEYAQRNGYGQQQPKQQAKLDPNDYYSFGPLLQDLVKRNGGMSKDVARALRARLGFNPDDNSPNNFVNQVMKREYGFSG